MLVPDPSLPLVVAVTGASGALLAHRFLLAAQEVTLPVHLVISRAARRTARLELEDGAPDWPQLAAVCYRDEDLAAPIASGSFPTRGMVVIPCSIKTLAAVAYGLTDNLIARAADVTLKERRQLVLAVRETPLNLVHLRAMTQATEAGAIVMPPVPMFYAGATSVEAMADAFAYRVLDLFGVAHPRAVRWQGASPRATGAGGTEGQSFCDGRNQA